MSTDYQQTLSGFLIGWLRGANFGRFQSLQICPTQRGSALFCHQEQIAEIRADVLYCLILNDTLGIKDLAAKLNVPSHEFKFDEFKENGWLNPKVFREI